MDEADTDVATTVTAQTDKSSFEIPEDGKPLKISTQKVRESGKQLEKSQTSLLIEYFEGSTKGDKTKARPSVRVKVTPSARKKSGSGGGSDAVQITNIGKDRKTSYTRRISLGSSRNVELGFGAPEGTEVSQSSDSSKPPIEVEVLDHNGSDLSTRSRGLMRAPYESNVSSMPPDSLLGGSNLADSELSPIMDRDEDTPTRDVGYLQEPLKQRDRSASRERIAQRIAEKVRQGSSKSRAIDDDTVSGAESSILSSNVQKSYRSGSDISNNPKLLGMVEDTIKRIILPEINAIKQDQKTDRNLRSLEGSRRGSILDDVYNRGNGLERRVSKSSSTPNISSRPKVVLNRDGEDPGTVLSRGDSERKKMRKSSRGSNTEERPSSRRSSGKHSYSYDDEDTVRAKSSKSSTKLRDTVAAAAAGGLLTAAALKHHDSQSEVRDGRKRRSKSRGSRSRSAGLTAEDKYTTKEEIPPLPMASNINDSEMTRESIVSDLTETPKSAGTHTPIREVSRGSLRDATSPASSRTPNRTPLSRGLGMTHTNQSIDSPKSPNNGISMKARMAGLAAAGLGGAAIAKGVDEGYDGHVDADGYGSPTVSQRKISSPVQSVSSLKKNFEEDTLSSKELRPRSAASRSSAGKRASQTSLPGGVSSPSTKLARSLEQSRDVGAGTYGTPDAGFAREGTPGTPTYGESVGDWYARQSLVNDQYRNSMDLDSSNRDSFVPATNRDSYQTNPFPQDEKRFTYFSEDGQDSPDLDAEQGVRGLGANPEYVHAPHRAESAVASLIIDPSTVSSEKLSPQASPTKGSYKQRMDAHLREMGKDTPPMYQGSTLSQTMPSQERWAAIKGHARKISSTDDVRDLRSPQQSPAKSIEEEPVMGASALPLADDALPEIGHFDDSRSDVTTNPSIIQGPLGGDATGRDPWQYTPQPQADAQRELSARNTPSVKSGHGKDAALLAGAAAGGALLAAAASKHQPSVEDEYEEDGKLTPDVGRRGYMEREATPTSPAAFRDEGYMTDAQARSSGALTPRADQQQYSKRQIDEFNRAMDAYDGPEDPFTASAQQSRNISGNSDGLDSPMYERATGKGIDNIQSKDVVALMDHLTVRDAQRNARDTEILVTLVRTAAEMRQSFDEIKKFIAEQDNKIMQNAERGNDQTVRKVLGGPRPLPTSSPHTPNPSKEDVQAKRKGVLRRALKGLTGSKSSNDLAKVEGMLMQILDNVEDLKHQGGAATRDLSGSYANDTSDTLDTYERLRNVPDPGYEPEGMAGTSSTPSHSGNLSLTPRAEKQQFHSGYDGRRGSVNRVSTVLEGDEDDLEPHESYVLEQQFENNERLLTPTQEVQRQRGLSPSNTPPQHAATFNGPQDQDLTPRSTEKQRKHKSNNSSVFGVPKVSRWSKTTASSAAPDPATLDSPRGMGYGKASSEASRSGADIARFDEEPYELRDDDRLRSTQSLAREQETRSIRTQSQASKLTRTPSPLIPSESSVKDREDRDIYVGDRMESPIQEDLDDGFDDPKYHAHRNSLLLEHPQPRQGPTGRHQNTLESNAHEYDPTSRTNSDLSQRTTSDFDPATWGSSGTAGLAKHRLSQFSEPLSPVSMSSPAAYGSNRTSRDEGPLIPQQQPKPAAQPQAQLKPKFEEEDDYDYYEPQYSASGFSRGGYHSNTYGSPWGSGHLLEPIEEVRYSLETDSGHVSGF
jgi:hypothetical protein